MRVIGDCNPTGDEGNSSKTKACKSITKAVPADGIVDTDSKATHSKLAKMKKKGTTAKRTSPAKTRDRVEGNPVGDEECTSISKKTAAQGIADTPPVPST